MTSAGFSPTPARSSASNGDSGRASTCQSQSGAP
jgi:hypothetical protein